MSAKTKHKEKFEINIYDSIKDIDKTSYNTLSHPENPFLEYEFLNALEQSGCVGERTSWIPKYLIMTEGGQIIGAITFYIKYDSYGEYIFDWEWAQAYHNAGLQYYPKAVVAIPFTPTNGVRILVDPQYKFEQCAYRMVNYLIDFGRKNKLSSIHFLFLTEKEHDFLQTLGFLSRQTHQYHWKNRGYNTFDDFLDDLRSNRKKQIRRERKNLRSLNIEIKLMAYDDIKEEHIDAMWKFYLDTHSRKWGSAYLNREFFDLMFTEFRHRLVMVLGKDRTRWIGGTFNIVKNNRLFGRYWGAIGNYKYLHFECCYYSLIDYAIRNKIETIEAGAQGEHKFLRGFMASPTFSSHYFNHKGANKIIEKYLYNERIYNSRLIKEYNTISPLKYLYGQA